MSPSAIPGYILYVVDLKLKVDALEAELDLTEERHAIQIESLEAQVQYMDRTLDRLLRVLDDAGIVDRYDITMMTEEEWDKDSYDAGVGL